MPKLALEAKEAFYTCIMYDRIVETEVHIQT